MKQPLPQPDPPDLNPTGQPRSIRCTGTHRTTGERCRRFAARGGFVCRRHGAAAPQVLRRAEQRVVDMQLEALAAKLRRERSTWRD